MKTFLSILYISNILAFAFLIINRIDLTITTLKPELTIVWVIPYLLGAMALYLLWSLKVLVFNGKEKDSIEHAASNPILGFSLPAIMLSIMINLFLLLIYFIS